MKIVLLQAILLIFLSTAAHAGEWQLVWSDEFDYTGLPDKKKWDYETGFVRNNEMQYYTKARKENARVEKGCLGIEWDEKEIRFFFDKINYFTLSTDTAGKGEENPFRKPHYLLINLALGGSWGGEIDDSVLPQRYLIDYVRVYERKAE